MTSILRVDSIQTSSGGSATASGLGIDIGSTGKIGQVVYGQTTTQVSSSSNSYVDTGITATITPSASSSTIHIFINIM